jgi:hypothetical protein
MFERELAALNSRETISLNRLEADIWRRERQIAARRSARRFLASGQGAVLIAAVILSGLAGAAVAGRYHAPHHFMVEETLAPSNLLLGSSR